MARHPGQTVLVSGVRLARGEIARKPIDEAVPRDEQVRPFLVVQLETEAELRGVVCRPLTTFNAHWNNPILYRVELHIVEGVCTEIQR